MEDIILYNSNFGEHKLIMAYPSKEEFALSSLGYLWLFKIAEESEGIATKRISTDNININSREIDSMAFSVSFDFDFMGILEILEKLKIPFYSNDRDENYPLIFAGGPVMTTNPRPFEKFFDFILIGDGEESFKQILDILKNNLPKQEALRKISEINGVYIPNTKAKRSTVSLSNVIYTPIISSRSYFKNTFIVEIARGCMNRCAFCTASYINLPFRYNEYQQILNTIEMGLKYTDKIALLGAQISAHPQFKDIMEYLYQKIIGGHNIELGISSLRTDAVSPNIIKTLVAGGQKHSTIAIEAASERLRKFINKNLKEDQILDAIQIAKENGLKGLKIYSMIGIPTETDNDIDEFLRLAKRIKSECKGFNIEFSFSTFVPKPQTPLQWSKREDTKSLEKKQSYLTKELSKLGFSSKFSSAKWDYWQTVLSRGDEKLSELLVYVYQNGGKIGAYKSGVNLLGLDISKAINGFCKDESLPWDILESVPTKEQLVNENIRLSKYSD